MLELVEYRNNEFLDDILSEGRTHLLAAFVQDIRNRKHLPCAGCPLVAGTNCSAVDHVGLTFRDYDRPDPQLDRNNITSRLLLQQYKGYK